MTHGEGVNIQAQDKRIRVGSWNLQILTFIVFFFVQSPKKTKVCWKCNMGTGLFWENAPGVRGECIVPVMFWQELIGRREQQTPFLDGVV